MQPNEEKKGSSVSGYLRTTALFVLILLNLWHMAVKQVEREEKRELSQIKAELLAEVKSLKDRLDAQLLREAEAKSDFDLFNEQTKRTK